MLGGKGDADTSNNNQRVDEEMIVDSGGGEENSAGRLVFSVHEKSVEELRSESAACSTFSVASTALEDNRQLPDSHICNQGSCQTSSCDISSNSASVSDTTVQEPVALSQLPSQDTGDIRKLICDEKDAITYSSAGERWTDIAVTVGGGDKNSVPFLKSCGDQSDDNVFIEDKPVQQMGCGDDPSSGRVHVHLDNNFNTFQYWRSPLPEVNIDFDIINGQPTNIHVVAKVKDEESKKVYASEMSVSISGSTTRSVADQVTDAFSDLALGDSISMSSSASSSYITSEVEKSGVRIHTASVSTVSDVPDETVAHIGSTHVLGQHLGEQHLAVVGGVVQGELLCE